MSKSRHTTLADIARAANVTKGTVSKVLNRRGGDITISTETVRRVEATAQELQYIPNRAAGSLKGGRTHLISLILSWNVIELMDRAEQSADRLGYSTMISFTPYPKLDTERRVIMSALERRVDGIIWSPGAHTEDYSDLVETIKRTGTPVVFIENSIDGFTSADLIESDFTVGLDVAIPHLIEQGYRRLAFVTYDLSNAARRKRADSVVDSGRRHGVDVELVLEDEGIAAAASIGELLVKGQEPIGVICEHDFFAIDVLKFAQSKGLTVPDDVGVMSMVDALVGDRYRIGDLTHPTVSGVVRPFGQEAARAVEVLNERITRKRKTSGEVIRIATEFVPRQSTRRRG